MAVANNLTITHPQIAAEWDYEKNNGLLPTDVTKGQVKKVYWKCKNGHSYSARIDHRCSPSLLSGCPYCSHKKVLPGWDDLATLYPEVAAEWDYSGNPAPPDQYLPFSNKKVSWICPVCRQPYKMVISNRTISGSSCPACAKERHTSMQEQALVYYFSKVTTVENRSQQFGKEIDVFLPDIHAGIEYNGEYYHTSFSKKDALKIETLARQHIRLITVQCGRERAVDGDVITLQTKKNANPSDDELSWGISEAFRLIGLPLQDIDIRRDITAIYSIYIQSIKMNSLSVKYPEIASEWNYERNRQLRPESFSYASNKRVWWTCPVCHNDYEMPISNRTSGNHSGCPYCAGKRIKVGFNDLATTHPDLVREWDTERNALSPQNVPKGTDRKAYWRCEKCGYRWSARISSRTAHKVGCPVCAGRITVAGFNDLPTLVPDAAALWNYARNPSGPDQFTPGSNQRAWWICNVCGHEWEAVINSVTSGRRCPICAKKNRPISRNKKLLETKGSLADHAPSLAKEWDAEKNGYRTPETVMCGSDFEAWWNCPRCGNCWQSKVYLRAVLKHGCPKCNAHKGAESRRKKVRNLDSGEVFASATEAAKAIGVSPSAITYACRHHSNCKGSYYSYTD